MRDIRRSVEQRECLKGYNTEVRFTFVRHSQKESGRVLEVGDEGISNSDLSNAGIERARTFGERNLTDRRIVGDKKVRDVGYATVQDRTRQTLVEAFQAAGWEGTKVLQEDRNSIGAFFVLPEARRSPGFMKQYGAIIGRHQSEYMAGHYPGKKFDDLTLDQQEEVAEYANEFALQWYLDFDDQAPDEGTVSPRDGAAAVAFKMNRLINLPDFMPNGRAIDIVSCGHKTSTESFLKYVIQRQVGESVITGFDSLEDMGGSLKILDSWDLVVRNNPTGDKEVIFVIRRESGQEQEFSLNLAVIKQLAQEAAEKGLAQSETKKIDQ